MIILWGAFFAILAWFIFDQFDASARRKRLGDVSASASIMGLLTKVLAVGVALLVGDSFGKAGDVLVGVLSFPWLFPTLSARLLLIPLGRYQSAYRLMDISWPACAEEEFTSYGVLCGALALTRRRADATQVEWLRDRLPEKESAIRNCALGLLLALDRQDDEARAIMLKVDQVEYCHRRFRSIARDWLVADALRSGDMPAASRIGRRGLGSMRWSYCVARLAERLDPERDVNRLPPHDWLLWLLWLAAPRRLRLVPLLQQALARPRLPPTVKLPPSEPGNAPDAMAVLAETLLCAPDRRYTPNRASFLHTVDFMEHWIDSPAATGVVADRLSSMQAIATSQVAAVQNTMRLKMVGLIKSILRNAPHWAETPEGELVRRAAQEIRNEMLPYIEARCRDYQERESKPILLPLADERRNWHLLRDTADLYLTLTPDNEEMLFTLMYVPVAKFAMQQHEQHARHKLAREMIIWLHRHARTGTTGHAWLARMVKKYRHRSWLLQEGR